MLNPNINYPYPLIRAYVEDYCTTVFKGDMTVNLQHDGYLVRPNFEINNPDIAEMISDGRLTYAIEVQSPATWYRKLFPVVDNKTFRLESGILHERVELTPCIIATSTINGFVNADFEEEYRGMSFDINAGDVIAIGESRSFDALYQHDIIKNGSSIVNIKGSNDTKEILCNFTGSLIEITLPAEQHKEYTTCGLDRTKYKTLNAILTIPALVEAIGIIANDYNTGTDSVLSKNAWYKTIDVNLKRIAENDENKYKKLLEKPFTTAELLLGNNYIYALKYVNQI